MRHSTAKTLVRLFMLITTFRLIMTSAGGNEHVRCLPSLPSCSVDVASLVCRFTDSCHSQPIFAFGTCLERSKGCVKQIKPLTSFQRAAPMAKPTKVTIAKRHSCTSSMASCHQLNRWSRVSMYSSAPVCSTCSMMSAACSAGVWDFFSRRCTLVAFACKHDCVKSRNQLTCFSSAQK